DGCTVETTSPTQPACVRSNTSWMAPSPLVKNILEDAGEPAEGTAPSAALRTRREPLDSPGSHCSNRERPPPAPMDEQIRTFPLDAAQPGKSATLVTAKTLVFPHGPTDDQPIEIIG